MTTSHRPAKVGEIWLAYLRFSDKPDLGKVRPVLVVSAERGSTPAIALKVTSKAPSSRFESIPIEDWEGCGLRKPSYMRLDQLFELTSESLLRDEPLGALDPRQLECIFRRLRGDEA